MNIKENKNLTNPLVKKTMEMPHLNGANFPERLPFSRVDGYTNLIRDEQTKAVLNTNINEYKNYKELKKIKEAENARINNLENDLNNIKDDLSEIKNLLRNLSNGS